MKSEQITELACALVKAQYAFTGAVKDSSNPFFKSKYADLESCWAAIKEPLAKNNLSISQMIQYDQIPLLETILMHASGQWISSSAPIIAAKQSDPQSFGAAITYMRRFALCAIVGLTQTDDDGNTAAGKAETMKPKEDRIVPQQPGPNDGIVNESPNYFTFGGLKNQTWGSENAPLWKCDEFITNYWKAGFWDKKRKPEHQLEFERYENYKAVLNDRDPAEFAEQDLPF